MESLPGRRAARGLVGVYISVAVRRLGSVCHDKLDDMNEIIFLVEEQPEGGYSARALGESIFTVADNPDELQAMVREAVACHFDEGLAPKIIRLHYVREEVISA